MKWPDVGKPREGHCQNVNDLFVLLLLLVIPLVLPVVVGCLVMYPRVLLLERPQIFVVMAQATLLLPEWPGVIDVCSRLV